MFVTWQNSDIRSNCLCSLILVSAKFAISSANIRQNKSGTSPVIKIPSAQFSLSKVHQSLINSANNKGLITSPRLVPILHGTAFV